MDLQKRVCDAGTELCRSTESFYVKELEQASLSVIVLGASGDLAKKKTFPALYALYCYDLLPNTVKIIGYARSKLTKVELVERIRPACASIVDDEEKLNSFFDKCSYVAGAYDNAQSFQALNNHLSEVEQSKKSNRLFYLALPPSVFVTVVSSFTKKCRTSTGWNRVIIEKPFGRDLETSRKLVNSLAEYLDEKEQYRIDHYLGKEMVQGLLVLRFSNIVFQPIWSHTMVNNVVITFKEPFGTEGRGGYFDKVGIIRDVMQNHLFQVLSLIAMERPVSLDAEHIRDEKVKVLRCIEPLKLENLVIGQYSGNKEGKPAYTDDDGVPNDSNCPTYAMGVFFIRNDRWDGVPFILKCGKALNERKAEVRMQFKDVPGQLFPNSARNEFVIRIQPDEATYMKVQIKPPGMAIGTQQTELDLHYAHRFDTGRLPEAYERLIFDVMKGDQSQFVRSDELDEAWKIFTPVLHELEEKKIAPVKYEYGSRGPKEGDELASKFGFKKYDGYSWTDPRSRV